MLRRKQKGQGLTEFALVLPLLLLLILGVFEASRIIWSYITVQAAAREAARYAVTGRPNVTSGSDTNCLPASMAEVPANNPNGEPWICRPDQRVAVIKAVAIARGNTLAVSDVCGEASVDEYTVNEEIPGQCGDAAGAFGVRVIGQQVDTTVDPPVVNAIPDYAGDQGLNVEVSTYYNVEMIDPIFNALMAGTFIRVGGSVQMQNEGLDQSLGFPPPPLPEFPLSGDGLPLGAIRPTITSLSGTEVEQNADLAVRLTNHSNTTQYDIHFKNSVTSFDAIICPAVDTDANNRGDFSCRIDGATFTTGDYYLYSTKVGSTTPIAIYGSIDTLFEEATLITVIAGVTPRIEIAGGNVWAARSQILIDLVNHPDAPFDLYFEVPGGTPQKIKADLPAEASDISWIVEAVGDACPQGSATPCRLFTRSQQPGMNDPYAETDIFINNPKITLSQGVTEYPQGALMIAFLEGHTPNYAYDIWIKSKTSTLEAKLTTVTTDGFGQFSAIEQFILASWPDGDYELISYAAGDTSQPIATTDITIKTPTEPYITVDGGDTWPIGSYINIRLHQHTANVVHYLEFGTQRIPIPGSVGDTFTMGPDGSFVQGFLIPLTAAVGSPQNYDIVSYLDAGGVEQARHTITVVPVPLIQVLEGDTALPNATITIRISNHSPNSSYTIFYGKEISDPNSVGKQLLTMITDANGEATQTYDLTNLPATPPPNFAQPDTCACYGKPYHMYSQALNGDQVAFTELTIDSADLAITKVEIPANAQINTTVPVTFTIQNLKPVTINRYFDIDLYLNPSPLIPTYNAGQFNFPGDVKYWKNFVAPNGQPGDTFTIQHNDFFVGQYGDQEVYGYADTTNLIMFENSEVNNIGHGTLSAVCVPQEVTSGFTWQERLYNPSNTTGTSATGGTITLTSDGLGTAGADDDASDRGHQFLYLQQPITTTAGFDVIVRVLDAPQTATNAKGGIELRNSVDNPQSMKIEFNLAWKPDKKNVKQGQHLVQVSLRNDTGASVTSWKSTDKVDLANGPVWLRVQREPGGSTFNFYYRQQSAKPATDTDWGAPYTTAGVGLNDQLYLGLFNASYVDNTNGTSKFDNFSYTDSSVCQAGAGQPAQEIPPGLTLCTDLLAETSFETAPPQQWRLGSDQGVFLGPSATGSHSGLYRLVAPTFDISFNNPYFYQQFIMPSWVVSSTTSFNLTLYKDVDALGSDDPDDQFYAVVATSPNPASRVTTPTLVADGVATFDWTSVNKGLELESGQNLETYAGQPLYIYFYNNSNNSCFGGGTCHDTQFKFDDVQLTSCTTQPPPPNVTSLLRGVVTLHRSGGSSEKLPGVKVWAYTEGGELHETFTDQAGNYSFYNLPAGEYIIYAEYNFIDAVDPTQIETLAANTTAVLKSGPPLIVALDLYAITP